MKNLFISLVMLIGFSFPQDCEEPVNVWFKISNDINSNNYGTIISVDMSNGYAYADSDNIYIIVLDSNTKEQIVLTFPFGYWEAGGEIAKEFKDLDDYLRNTQRNGTEIKKQ